MMDGKLISRRCWFSSVLRSRGRNVAASGDSLRGMNAVESQDLAHHIRGVALQHDVPRHIERFGGVVGVGDGLQQDRFRYGGAVTLVAVADVFEELDEPLRAVQRLLHQCRQGTPHGGLPQCRGMIGAGSDDTAEPTARHLRRNQRLVVDSELLNGDAQEPVRRQLRHRLGPAVEVAHQRFGVPAPCGFDPLGQHVHTVGDRLDVDVGPVPRRVVPCVDVDGETVGLVSVPEEDVDGAAPLFGAALPPPSSIAR